MSLTQQIEQQDSPVRQWMNARLHDQMVKNFVREVNDHVAPITPIETPGTNWSLVGTAFDYGFRWLLGPMDNACAASRGANLIDEGNPRFFLLMQIFGIETDTETMHRITSIESAQQVLHDVIEIGDSTKDPRVRAQCCIALALFEQVYRAGFRVLQPNEGLLPILSKPYTDTTVQELLDTTPEPSVADVMALLETVPDVWGADLHQPCILNPSFVSSPLVGAADADWIMAQTLYDCKCTRKTRPLGRSHLLQLLGYVLLDSDDAYAIRSAGWYYPRQCKRIVYPVTELLERVFGTTDLAGLRNSFRDMLRDNAVQGYEKRVETQIARGKQMAEKDRFARAQAAYEEAATICTRIRSIRVEQGRESAFDQYCQTLLTTHSHLQLFTEKLQEVLGQEREA